jgi:hypothetical protein
MGEIFRNRRGNGGEGCPNRGRNPTDGLTESYGSVRVGLFARFPAVFQAAASRAMRSRL